MYDNSTPVGKTFSTTSSYSSTVDSFHFWVDKQTDFKKLEPGTVVAVNDGLDVCFAVVEGLQENMDYSNPLEAYASHNFGDANYESKTDRFVCQAVGAKILRWSSGTIKPVSGEQKVYLANSRGVKFAFSISDKGIPIGFSTTPAGTLNNQSCKIILPDNYLFGKEAQGVNIGGQTGYAKTNLALNIALLSLYNLDDLCIIGINVKGEDLLWLDKINPELTEFDKQLWKSLGITDLKWLNFKIFAPAGISLRKDGKEISFALSWEDVKYDLNLLFSESKEDENALFCVSHIASLPEVQSFTDALNLLAEWEDAANRGAKVPGNHHLFTIKKVIKHLRSLSRQSFINENFKKQTFPELLKHIKPKTFITFDLNDVLLSSHAQRIIFQKVLNKIKYYLESKELKDKTGVERVAVFIDELSKYAHRRMSSESFLAKVKLGIKNIAERGRFSGLSLLGVEQYPSQIDENIIENMATRFYTRLKASELSSELYKYYAKDYTRAISRLDKGIALLDHDTFPEPLFVRFPRTLCATNYAKPKNNPKNLLLGVK